MEEIIEDVFHWSTVHDPIGAAVSSYFVRTPAVVIDPKVPDAGFDALPGPPAEVLLSSGHHLRDATAFAEHYGIPIRALPAAVQHIGGEADVMSLAPGETIEGAITPLSVGAICPDECALHIARGPGALVIADGVQHEQAELAFFSDRLLGDDPEAVRDALRRCYRHLLGAFTFDALLFAHGAPIASGGAEALRAFVAG